MSEDLWRGTGRTRRMLLHAVDQAGWGGVVQVVAATADHRRAMLRECLEMATLYYPDRLCECQDCQIRFKDGGLIRLLTPDPTKLEGITGEIVFDHAAHRLVTWEYIDSLQAIHGGRQILFEREYLGSWPPLPPPAPRCGVCHRPMRESKAKGWVCLMRCEALKDLEENYLGFSTYRPITDTMPIKQPKETP